MTTKATTKATYDVTPQNGGWLIHMAGDGVTEWRVVKADAVRRARELARLCDEWRVRVYSQTGALEEVLGSAAEHES